MKDYLVLQNNHMHLIYMHIIISEKYNPLIREVVEANNELTYAYVIILIQI